jgi:CDP-paratose 2-epimerase
MQLECEEAPERESDHLWWISDISKFQNDYPSWKMTKDLDYIFNEIIDYYVKKLELDIKISAKDYFSKVRNK